VTCVSKLATCFVLREQDRNLFRALRALQRSARCVHGGQVRGEEHQVRNRTAKNHLRDNKIRPIS
jgi:hypothetical protein